MSDIVSDYSSTPAFSFSEMNRLRRCDSVHILLKLPRTPDTKAWKGTLSFAYILQTPMLDIYLGREVTLFSVPKTV